MNVVGNAYQSITTLGLAPAVYSRIRLQSTVLSSHMVSLCSGTQGHQKNKEMYPRWRILLSLADGVPNTLFGQMRRSASGHDSQDPVMTRPSPSFLSRGLCIDTHLLISQYRKASSVGLPSRSINMNITTGDPIHLRGPNGDNFLSEAHIPPIIYLLAGLFFTFIPYNGRVFRAIILAVCFSFTLDVCTGRGNIITVIFLIALFRLDRHRARLTVAQKLNAKELAAFQYRQGVVDTVESVMQRAPEQRASWLETLSRQVQQKDGSGGE